MNLPPASFTPGAEPLPYMPPDALGHFTRRARRLRALAADSRWADWLGFVARLADWQAGAVRQIELMPPPEDAELLAWLPQQAGWQAVLDGLLAGFGDDPNPALRQAVAALRQQSPQALAEQALRLRAGEVAAAELGQAPLLAAALEVGATWWAAQAQPGGFGAVSDSCPVCASAPVASVIHGEGGLRYLHCGLCNCAWHHVRAQCTRCGSAETLSYRAIEGDNPVWRAEACDDCGDYLKILQQAKAPELDPVADDLASLALDLALGEAGYRRRGANPYLLLSGEA